MNRTTFSLDIFGDRLPWLVDDRNAGDNRAQLAHLKKSLARAMETELTQRQKEILQMFYFDGMSVTDIAHRQSVNKSTVSRHLTRARENLRRALKFNLFPIWTE